MTEHYPTKISRWLDNRSLLTVPSEILQNCYKLRFLGWESQIGTLNLMPKGVPR